MVYCLQDCYKRAKGFCCFDQQVSFLLTFVFELMLFGHMFTLHIDRDTAHYVSLLSTDLEVVQALRLRAVI